MTDAARRDPLRFGDARSRGACTAVDDRFSVAVNEALGHLLPGRISIWR